MMYFAGYINGEYVTITVTDKEEYSIERVPDKEPKETEVNE